MILLPNRKLDNMLVEKVKPIEPPRALLERAKFLERDDWTLVELAMRGNLSRRRIASLVRRNPSSIGRRLNILGARLRDPLIVDLLDRDCDLPPLVRRLGIEHYLLRHSVRQIAQKHDMTMWRVRMLIHFVRGWHRGLRTRRPARLGA